MMAESTNSKEQGLLERTHTPIHFLSRASYILPCVTFPVCYTLSLHFLSKEETGDQCHMERGRSREQCHMDEREREFREQGHPGGHMKGKGDRRSISRGSWSGRETGSS